MKIFLLKRLFINISVIAFLLYVYFALSSILLEEIGPNSPILQSTTISAQINHRKHVQRLNSTNTVVNYNKELFDYHVSLDEQNYYPLSNKSLQILIICTSTSSKNVHNVLEILDSIRFKYKIEIAYFDSGIHRPIRLQTRKNQGLYSLIIVEHLDLLEHVGFKSKQYILDYCRKFLVGLIFMSTTVRNTSYFGQIQLDDNKATTKYEKCWTPLKSCTLKPTSDNSFFKLTKLNVNEELLLYDEENNNTCAFSFRESQTNQAVVHCDFNTIPMLKTNDDTSVRKVFIGVDLFVIPIMATLFVDSISFASYNRLQLNYSVRHIQIDIDDIFVASAGLRMIPSDVSALISFQEELNENVFNTSNFKFNLGFSGGRYKTGNDNENRADELLIENRHKFYWFEHNWVHFKAHMHNSSHQKEQMYYNFNFALNYDLPAHTFYAVEPHHSGIYPVDDYLYDLWSDIWQIKATSTEKYPHSTPVHLRRGFIHKGIMVLPRQTCGIFTHTMYFDKYPGGLRRLLRMANGGEIFRTVVFNRVVLFMTHMTNYAHDRLALFVFKNLFNFVLKWTNLKLVSLPPLATAKKYFEFYEEEKEPLWTNPCEDQKLMLIWSRNASFCSKFPNLIIIGPQKTGTTALHMFLKAHPQIESNKNTPSQFEETQFFTDKYYTNGINWYLSFFEHFKTTTKVLFEKSANYFADEKSPKRIKALLKNNVKLVFIVIDPATRAYSWYQHMKSHNDSAAISFEFYDIITMNFSRAKNNSELIEKARALHNRCLIPGFYYKHFKNWLEYFPRKQLMMIDGELLREKPHLVLKDFQRDLALEFVDYSRFLRYNRKKKFFCQQEESKMKCLGSSKGRVYEKMDERSRLYLRKFYFDSNRKFVKLLKQLSYKIPNWLQ